MITRWTCLKKESLEILVYGGEENLEESILKSIRSMIGPYADCEEYDVDLITAINSAFFTLHQLGVGPIDTFQINGIDEKWADFFDGNESEFQMVKTYVYLSTRLDVDPPTTQSILSSMERRKQECEWRLNFKVEGGDCYGLYGC